MYEDAINKSDFCKPGIVELLNMTSQNSIFISQP